MNQSQSPKEALKALVRRLSNAAFNAGHEDAGDAWTRQEKTAAAKDQVLNETLAAIDQLGVPAEGHEEVGLFSVGVDGSLCFHKAVRDAQRLTSTLNRTVTGGPYKARVAYAGPLITAAPKERA